MGTNVAPILANLCLAKLEQELETTCTEKNIKCTTFYKRFMDDSFGIFIGTQKETYPQCEHYCKKIFSMMVFLSIFDVMTLVDTISAMQALCDNVELFR